MMEMEKPTRKQSEKQTHKARQDERECKKKRASRKTKIYTRNIAYKRRENLTHLILTLNFVFFGR